MYLKSQKMSNSSTFKKSLNFWLCLVVTIFTIICRNSSIMSTLEMSIYDFRMRLLSTLESPSQEIIIIGVDNESLSRLEPAVGRWPWPRAVFAGLIDYCSNAQTIAIDILFSEADSYYTSSDDLFVEEVKKQKNVVLALYLSNQASNNSIPKKVVDFALNESFAIHHPLMRYHSALFPYSALAEVSGGFGHVNYPIDNDGVLRSYILASRLGEKIYPSLALAAAMKYNKSTSKELNIDEDGLLHFNSFALPLDASGKFRILTISKKHKTYTVADILDSWRAELKGEIPKIKRDEFDGKIVFIGSTATGLLEDHQMITGLGGVEGVRIEALALDNLLNGKFIKIMSEPGQMVLIAFLCFLPLIPRLQRPKTMIIMMASLSLTFLLISAYCLFSQKLMLPITAPFFGLFMSSIVLSLGYWYSEISQRKKLELNLRDAYKSLQVTHEKLEEYSQTLEAKVDDRTSELKEKNSELEHEITERKRIEEKLVKQAEELAVTNQKLTSISRHKDQFLANMSHELRTPLNAILGASELLREGIHGPMTSNQLKCMRMVSSSGQHLLDLINDILDLAKIEEGKIELNMQSVSVASICDISMQFIKQLAYKKGIKISVNHNDRKVNKLNTDARRLKQILVNLLTNAAKFTENNGQVGLEVIGDTELKQIRFIVWDTGIGISEDEREKLFQPFVQLDSSLIRQHEGTGLGLSLVDRIAKVLGGQVSVESQVGHGSRFTVSLPWQQEENLDDTETLKETNKESSPAISTLKLVHSQQIQTKILLAEDNEAAIETIRDFLEFNGFEVAVARDGVAAVALAKDDVPDLILMDIQMPRMDGLEAMRQLRADLKFQKVPILALTALAMQDDLKKCIVAGADKYISKPVRLQNLLCQIQELLP